MSPISDFLGTEMVKLFELGCKMMHWFGGLAGKGQEIPLGFDEHIYQRLYIALSCGLSYLVQVMILYILTRR
jgi:hypothetical protein